MLILIEISISHVTAANMNVCWLTVREWVNTCDPLSPSANTQTTRVGQIVAAPPLPLPAPRDTPSQVGALHCRVARLARVRVHAESAICEQTLHMSVSVTRTVSSGIWGDIWGRGELQVL